MSEMNDRITWVAGRARWAWGLLVGGAIVLVGGAIGELVYASAEYSYRAVTGLGIALTAIGAMRVVRYRKAQNDAGAAKRLVASERDERIVMIRTAAGNRAYVASSIVVYAGLMWVSLASNGRLPVLEGDALWNFLAAAVLIPAGVYVASLIVGERRS